MSPSLAPAEDAPMLCCGLCRMKVYHRNIFRNLFRRAQNSPLKNGSESPEFAVSSQQQEAKRHLGPPGQESSWSPSLSVTPSSRCTYHWTSRKGSVLSFGDVDSREVHRMMKYINRSKVHLSYPLSRNPCRGGRNINSQVLHHGQKNCSQPPISHIVASFQRSVAAWCGLLPSCHYAENICRYAVQFWSVFYLFLSWYIYIHPPNPNRYCSSKLYLFLLNSLINDIISAKSQIH